MSDTNQSIEREVTPGPMLKPDLDIMSLVSEPPNTEVRSSKVDSIEAVPIYANGAGGLYWV